MHWIFLSIIILLVCAIAWAFVEYRRSQLESGKIFDEYLDNQRQLKFRERRKIPGTTKGRN